MTDDQSSQNQNKNVQDQGLSEQGLSEHGLSEQGLQGQGFQGQGAWSQSAALRHLAMVESRMDQLVEHGIVALDWRERQASLLRVTKERASLVPVKRSVGRELITMHSVEDP